jgi:hypothetical protein
MLTLIKAFFVIRSICFCQLPSFEMSRPILEYADVVWDNKTLLLINKLENVQIEAARVVTGGTRLVSSFEMSKPRCLCSVT